MTSIENYKSKMGDGLKIFFEKYEPEIKKLISDLDSKGFLEKTSFQQEDVQRLGDIAITSNGALSLINDFNRIITIDEVKTEENLKKLKEAGWNVDKHRFALQYGVILSYTYHAFLERLKNYFISFIDFQAMGKDPTKMFGVGKFLEELKKHSPNNDFLEYFDSGIRNSIAHFTFFWKNGEIYFCKNLFDRNPTKQKLSEFMMEVKNINALVEGFHLIYRDFVGMLPTDNFVD